MRIAVGVLFIICAVINGCAGSLYALGGAVAAGAGEVASEVAAEMDKAEGVDIDQKAVAKDAEEVKATGGALMFFGFFLFVMVGLQIAAAVMLFMSKKPMFIQVIAGLTIAAEVIGILITTFGLTNLVGFATAGLAFVAIKGMSAATGGGTAAA